MVDWVGSNNSDLNAVYIAHKAYLFTKSRSTIKVSICLLEFEFDAPPCI